MIGAGEIDVEDMAPCPTAAARWLIIEGSDFGNWKLRCLVRDS